MRSVMASRGLIVNSSNDNCDDPVCGFRIIWLKCEISSPFLGLTLEVEGFWESVGVGRLVDEVSIWSAEVVGPIQGGGVQMRSLGAIASLLKEWNIHMRIDKIRKTVTRTRSPAFDNSACPRGKTNLITGRCFTMFSRRP